VNGHGWSLRPDRSRRATPLCEESVGSAAPSLTYPEVGASAGDLPSGYRHLTAERHLGSGTDRFQQAVEQREQVIVGVNGFVATDEPPFEILYIDESAGEQQLARMADVKARRDPQQVSGALEAMRRAASGSDNLMPPILDAVRAYATLGEMCDVLRDVWGEWTEEAVI